MMFERHRRARPWSLLVAPALVAAGGWLIVRRPAAFDVLAPVTTATRGLVQAEFLLYLALLVAVVAVIVVTAGIRPDDTGLHRDYLGRGIGVVAMIWGASQVVGVLPRVVANRPVLLDREFEYGSRWELGGEFLTALAQAGVEEIVFRGFLLVQLYLLFNRGRQDEEAGLSWAIILAVVVTNLALLPRTLPYPSLQVAATDQAVLLLGGVFLSWLFVRTRNLFFAIGVHALLVAPTPVVAGPSRATWYPPLVIAILASVWVMLWPRRD